LFFNITINFIFGGIMRIKNLMLIIMIIIFVTTLTFLGCKGEAAEEAAAEEAAAEEASVEEAAEEAAAEGEVVAEEELVFYWISHGSEGDPYWVYVINSGLEAGEALGVKVNASFHANDIATHKEAFSTAIAANANGIVSSCPEIGVLTEEVALAKEKGIPVIFSNTDDPNTERDAYVGADLYQVGVDWAKYLVDNDLVKEGDFVWMPVEVPGATYQVEETEGAASIFDPLGIKYEVFDANYDPATAQANITDYLTAHGNEVDAIIGLGNVVTSTIHEAFAAVGWEAGKIPVVGWGVSSTCAIDVKDGYINAATWQYPAAQGYIPIYMLYEAATGASDIGYQVITAGMYTKEDADLYIELCKKME
jgi:simple sugar transport system substrate-binding protein